ncbi:hypothetical protein BJX70DRAFT_396996 [Aspergillus crustosus]
MCTTCGHYECGSCDITGEPEQPGWSTNYGRPVRNVLSRRRGQQTTGSTGQGRQREPETRIESPNATQIEADTGSARETEASFHLESIPPHSPVLPPGVLSRPMQSIRDIGHLLLKDDLIAGYCQLNIGETHIVRSGLQERLKQPLYQFAKELSQDPTLEQYCQQFGLSILSEDPIWASRTLHETLISEISWRSILGFHPVEIAHLAAIPRPSERRTLESIADVPNPDWPKVVVHTKAYQSLRQNIFNLLYPSAYQKIRALADKTPIMDYLQCRRPNSESLVLTELRYLSLGAISIEPSNASSAGVAQGWLNEWKGAIETRSKTRWDWWSLRPYMRNLAPDERRLYWTCECGQRRWAVVSSSYAAELQECVDKYLVDERDTREIKKLIAEARARVLRAQSDDSNPNGSSTHTTIKGPPPSTSGAIAQATLAIPSAFKQQSARPTPVSQSISRQAQGPGIQERYVLLTVKRGDRHFISQVDVHQKSDNMFFRVLRAEYFRLRGWARNLFSVWRYSHCDFYQFEKFDDAEYTPKQQNDYPVPNQDYDFTPEPMDIVPPISEHEFYCKFYACYHSNHSLSHLFHTCRRFTDHCNDALELLPKRKYRLEEHGSKRERFWGIYAREVPCFRWVVGYNVLCMLPMVVYFFICLFLLGYQGDLQNAAVPLTVMLGMLALFWTLFLGSFRYDGS